MKVLIAEDDEVLREWLGGVIQRAFPEWVIFVVSNGKRAFEIFNEHGGAIDLIITDNQMPEMSGIEFIDRVRQIKPEQKVIMVCGGAKTDAMTQLQVVHFRKGDLKPFPNFLRRMIDGFNDPELWK